MRIDFHGAAHTVTGSQHLITIGGWRVLLDCGLYQGRRQDTYQRNLNFPFPIESVDAVILSHAHIDHSGNLPNLVKQGYAGPVYATRATCELAEVMLLDSGHIQEEDAVYVNKRRFRRGRRRSSHSTRRRMRAGWRGSCGQWAMTSRSRCCRG
jgi:metallo-beta-lactamase family protein